MKGLAGREEEITLFPVQAFKVPHVTLLYHTDYSSKPLELEQLVAMINYSTTVRITGYAWNDKISAFLVDLGADLSFLFSSHGSNSNKSSMEGSRKPHISWTKVNHKVPNVDANLLSSGPDHCVQLDFTVKGQIKYF